MEGKVAPPVRRTLTPAVMGSVLFVMLCAVVAIAVVAGRGGIQMPVAALGSPGASRAAAGATPVPQPSAGGSGAGSTSSPSVGPSPAPATVAPATIAPSLEPTAPPPSSIPSSGPGPSFDPLAVLPPCTDGRVCYEYVVRRGDTLSSVASRYLIPVGTVLALNPEVTDASTIVVGQVMYLGRDPFARLEPCGDAPDCHLYTVRPGDLLSSICGRFGLTVADVLAANPSITDPNAIYSGQVIRLPRPA